LDLSTIDSSHFNYRAPLLQPELTKHNPNSPIKQPAPADKAEQVVSTISVGPVIVSGGSDISYLSLAGIILAILVSGLVWIYIAAKLALAGAHLEMNKLRNLVEIRAQFWYYSV